MDKPSSNLVSYDQPAIHKLLFMSHHMPDTTSILENHIPRSGLLIIKPTDPRILL
jgi:hypothetical protein